MIYQVILDTNFLLLPFELNVDIITELERILEINYEIIIFSEILTELENLSDKSSGNLARNIKSAINFSKKIKKIDYFPLKNEKVDDLIIRYAENNPCIVATNDKNLKKRLRSKNVPIIFLRKKKYLKLEGTL